MILPISEEPWNSPQYVIEVKSGTEGENCAIMANVTLKCKLKDTAGHPYVQCYQILKQEPEWLENKFPKEFFSFSNYTKLYAEATSTDGKKQNTQQRVSKAF